MPIDWGKLWTPEQSPVETLVRASLVYIAVHLLLRFAGRKELSRYSSFDLTFIFLITVAVRRAITVDDASVPTAIIAMATLIGWNVLLSWLSFRSGMAAKVLEGAPRLLMRDGITLDSAMRASRVSVDELKARLRTYGTQDFAVVREAYLETDGRITFVLVDGPGTRTRNG